MLVSHADFIAQVTPLAAQRQQQGHQAVVVDIEDVYDEFSFGEKTPQAIKDFLRWARTWATAPKFVVLAGDATIDPRDYEGLGNADFVPTKQVPMNQASLETASDDWFVDFNNNGLPDIAIGRLSVRTPQQADDDGRENRRLRFGRRAGVDEGRAARRRRERQRGELRAPQQRR